MNARIPKVALAVGVISLLLGLLQALAPASEGVLLRALLIGQLLILLAIALLLGATQGESSDR